MEVDIDPDETYQVKITKKRWSVEFEFTPVIGGVHRGMPITLVASADSFLTYGDGIWLGSKTEEEELMGLGIPAPEPQPEG